ncbi:MAG: hypothetical protein ABEH65_05050 [Halobacteriales archaeon]
MSAGDSMAAVVSLPPDWTEREYRSGTFGPDDRAGIEATLELDPEDDPVVTVEVLPVRYRRTDGEERIEWLTQDLQFNRQDFIRSGDVAPTTAFAVTATYTPVSREEQDLLCVAADADDALAIAVWLAQHTDNGRHMREHLQIHVGSHPNPKPQDINAGDEVLAATLPETPEDCLVSGTPTNSHHVRIPYRYYPYLPDAPHTSHGVPRFPSTVDSLAAVIAHRVWTNYDLSDGLFSAPLDRRDSGEYALKAPLCELLGEGSIERVALNRLGDGD